MYICRYTEKAIKFLWQTEDKQTYEANVLCRYIKNAIIYWNGDKSKNYLHGQWKNNQTWADPKINAKTNCIYIKSNYYLLDTKVHKRYYFCFVKLWIFDISQISNNSKMLIILTVNHEMSAWQHFAHQPPIKPVLYSWVWTCCWGGSVFTCHQTRDEIIYRFHSPNWEVLTPLFQSRQNIHTPFIERQFYKVMEDCQT